ncbi:MAG: hypothetical protein GXO50_09875, partial [Chlorobi bacterium]|nr:hypothetical protein [Chlorobiota bacterium]
YEVIRAIIPAAKNETGVPPFPKETANPKTANIPPPTIPPIPIKIASFSPVFFESVMF